MIRTQIYLPQDLYRRIRLLAERDKKPAAEMIRELLSKGIATRQQRNAGDGLLEIAKIGAKGPKDLSQNIDKYLYEEYE